MRNANGALMMDVDIRDRAALDHDAVMALNFISSTAPVRFRRHYRQGLRSHIMEILDPQGVLLERTGTMIDGVRRFPRARPRCMLRIFRTPLSTLAQAVEEIERVKIVERFLAPHWMARSVECIVDYRQSGRGRPLLCGFQEYVAGVILDPWTILDHTALLADLYDRCRAGDHGEMPSRPRWKEAVVHHAACLVTRVKRMIGEAGHIPDLAGVGNLIVTPAGEIRLVDINNISRVSFESSIPLDEKGYPACDKSIEALSLIEAKVAGRSVDRRNTLLRHYLDPARMRSVKAKEEGFRKQPCDP